MKLFSRRVQMSGPPAEIMQYSTEMCAYVTEKVGREVALWNGLFGGPIGTMLYATRVEGIADLRSATEGLLADPEYHAKIAAAADLIAAPSEDSLGTAIHGEIGDQSPPVGSYAAVTTAQIATGRYADAIGWAVEVAQQVESVTGMGVAVLTNSYGPFGTLNWISVSPDAAGVDAANDAIAGDEGYMQMLAGTGGLFVEGSGNQALITRVA
jgi:hypothetical protein